MTVGAMLRRRANIEPALVAYRYGERSLTFGELDERVDHLAGALAARGVQRGDRVATLMYNGIEHIEVLLAAARLGALFVPINFRLAAREVAQILAHAEPRVVVVDSAAADVGSDAFRAAGVASILTIAERPDRPEDEPYETAVAEAAVAAPIELPDVAEHDDLILMYTSGTTGLPKGVVLTHFNLLINTFTKLVTHEVKGQDEVWLSALPMCHIAGVGSIFPCLMLGGTCVLLPSTNFDAAEVVDLFESERVTSCFLVPTQWAQVCAVPDAGKRARWLRQIAWGGSNSPRSTLEAMVTTFPHAHMYATFGQTEMSPLTCVLRGEDAVRKLGSVGKPVPNLEVRIVDDDMNDVPDGEIGEIVYRGPTMLREYWRDEATTAEAFRGGWFHSGDLVRRDEEGFIYVVDRKKDMIISGGENIYSAEIEAVLHQHPGVAEAAVVGAPHEKWGETPVAVIVATDASAPPTFEEITDWCRASLASFKKPSKLVVLDALPRNASGKVLKHQLRSVVGEDA